MVPILILAGSVLFAVLRRTLMSRRTRRRPSARVAPARRRLALPAAGGDLGLVATREVRARLGGRVFRAGTLLMMAAAAAAIVIPVLERGRNTERIGVVGAISAPARAAAVTAGSSVDATVHLVSEPSTAAMRADLRSGRVEVSVINGRQVWVDRAISPSDTSTTAQVARALSRSIGLSPAQSAALTDARPLPVRSLEPEAITAATRTASIVAVFLLFVLLTQYNTWTLVGVMEEKTSRVVEVLLAAVGPAKLLTGKVLGIGLVVFIQAGIVFGFAFGLAHAVGSDLVHGTAPSVLVAAIVWLVLGYAFNCWVYAAAGSMTERQSQVQTLAFPLALPVIFGYFVAITALASGAPSTLLHVLAYVPPTAPFAVTVLTALGALSWWQFAISAAICVSCTVGVARLAMAVYRRSILRTGARVRLGDLVPLGLGRLARGPH